MNRVDSLSPLVSIAELIRQWGQPPEVIRADWAVQLMSLVQDSHVKCQFGLNICEDSLLVDEEGRLCRRSSVSPTGDKSQGDFDWHASQTIINRWRSHSVSGNSELDRAWQHVDRLFESIQLQIETPPHPIAQPSKQENSKIEFGFDSRTNQSNDIQRHKTKRRRTKRKLYLQIGIVGACMLGFMAWLAWPSPKSKNQDPVSVASTLSEPPSMFNITDSDNSGAIDSDELSTVASLVPRDGPSLDTLASTAGLIPVEMLDIPSFPSPPVAFSSESGTVSGSDLNLPTSDTPAIRTSPEPDAAAIPDVVEIAVDVPENTVLPPRSKTEKTVLLDVVPSSIKSIRINQPDRELPISNGADGSWAIKDSSLNGEPVIAVIFRQESHIFWQWQPAAIRSAMANSLPNAFLNFDFDMGQPIGLALRSPNIFSDWRPDLEQGETRNIYALEPAPDRTTYVMVQVVAPGEIKTEWDSAEITTPFRRGERTVRFVNSREKLVTVQTRLEWTGNHRFTLNLHAELRLDPAASWVSANVPLLDARNQQLEAYRLACQQQLTFLKENYGSTRQEPQRSMVRSQRDRLEITLKQIDLIAKRMTSARSLLHDLQTRSQWHLEIATPWPNRVPQVILKLEPEAVVSAAQSKDKPERPKDKPE